MKQIPKILDDTNNKTLREAVRLLVDDYNARQFVSVLVDSEPLEKKDRPSWSEGHEELRPEIGSVRPHPYSDKMQLRFDGRGWQNEMKDLIITEEHHE